MREAQGGGDKADKAALLWAGNTAQQGRACSGEGSGGEGSGGSGSTAPACLRRGGVVTPWRGIQAAARCIVSSGACAGHGVVNGCVSCANGPPLVARDRPRVLRAMQTAQRRFPDASYKSVAVHTPPAVVTGQRQASDRPAEGLPSLT